jgi:hypothetical protein
VMMVVVLKQKVWLNSFVEESWREMWKEVFFKTPTQKENGGGGEFNCDIFDIL